MSYSPKPENVPMALTLDEHKELHDEIILLFDLADEVIQAVDDNTPSTYDLKIGLIEPFILDVQKGAEQLSDSYLHFVQNKEMIDKELLREIESAMRLIFSAVLNFIEEVKSIPEGLGQSAKLKSVLRKAAQTRKSTILERMLKNTEALRIGPYQNEMRRQEERLPDFSPIIGGVREVGYHNMLIGRAFHLIGLIESVEKVEPGAALTGVTLAPDRTKSFSDMLRKAQETNQKGLT